MGEPDTDKPAQYITNTNKSLRYKNPDRKNIYPSIVPVPDSSRCPLSDPMDEMDWIGGFEQYRELIMENIEYDCLCERYDQERLDEIIEIMLDAICGKRDHIRIGGADYPAEMVKSRLLSINSEHIEYVMDCLNDSTAKVNKIDAYLLKCLYTAPTTIDSYYSSLVNHDWAASFRKK